MSRRRYKIGLNPQYDRRFDLRKEQSALLNPTGQRMNWTALEASSGGAARMLTEYQERHEGALQRLANHEEQYEGMKLAAEAEGRPAPTLPEHLVEEKLLAEAEADVRGEEVDLLQKMVKDAAARKEVDRSRSVLPYGPFGDRKGSSRHVPGSREVIVIPLVIIDGQKVSYRNDLKFTDPYINDPLSPYDQLPLTAYWKLVEDWRKTHRERKPISPADLPARPPGKVEAMVTKLKNMAQGK